MISLLAGCLNDSEGPELFSDGVPIDEEIIETTDDTGTGPIEEFGFLVPETLCVKQLHGGCVSADYTLYDSDILGIHFMRPLAWTNSKAGETQLSFVEPSDDENNVTKLIVWRSVDSSIATYQETVNQKIVDAGTAVMGPYDVKWEIYEGTLNDQPVKAEWVTLTMDEYNPWINFTFLLVTEPENFLADQFVLKGAVSSVVVNTPGLE